jgi:flavin reductase (DIM6/NTAB) family NADH-FMN oxidoreductase RutF
MGTKSPFELKPKYADFAKVQASRPDFNPNKPVTYTKPPNPTWRYGDSASLSPEHEHVEIDPYHPDRPMISNYRLLISAIPRPISFVSTVSKDGTRNLAPFSYFQVVDHDPPTFVIGFSGRPSRPKDTQKNLVETGECVINIVSEHFIEASNATSLDIAADESEWGLSGLEAALSATVRPDRVKDAVFSIEGKLLEMKDLDYGHGENKKAFCALAIIQATRFWARSDAINETGDELDLAVLRPLVQLGGMQYGRVREAFELPRPSLGAEMERLGSNLLDFVKRRDV